MKIEIDNHTFTVGHERGNNSNPPKVYFSVDGSPIVIQPEAFFELVSALNGWVKEVRDRKRDE